MLAALATVHELEARLGLDPSTLADADLARAQAALDDVSALVRYETNRDFVDGAGVPNAPAVVVRIVLGAALRNYRNPDGEIVQGTGPFTRTLKAAEVSALLTDAEKSILRTYRPVSNDLWTQRTTRGEDGDITYFMEDTYGCELWPIGYVDQPWR